MTRRSRHYWRWRPLIECSEWGGDMDDGNSSVSGWSISLAWLGLYGEFVIARERPRVRYLQTAEQVLADTIAPFREPLP